MCVAVSSGRRHSLYVNKYQKITLRWGYRHLQSGPPRLAPYQADVCAVWSLDSTILGWAVLGEAAEMMEKLATKSGEQLSLGRDLKKSPRN